ncbi:Amidohydrolase-related protein [Raphanus sativus]|nr:Amidohydrolase-related protein [Raphanus sativus]
MIKLITNQCLSLSLSPKPCELSALNLHSLPYSCQKFFNTSASSGKVCGCNSHTTTSPSQQKRSFPGGLHPYNYCLPVLKREIHREAIVKAVTSGSKKFFLGTDSAPHERRRKESSCGCAGIYSAPVALSLYAKVFDEAGALDKLEAFTSFNGPDFYGLPRNSSKITLKKAPWKVPEVLTFSFGEIVPMFAGETLQWQPSFE